MSENQPIQIIMFYKQAFLADRIASELEDFLDIGCVVPVVGALPALSKSLFGVVQCAAATLVLVASVPYCFHEAGRDMFVHSLRHIIHGLANILSGLIQAVPLISSLIWCLRLLKSVGASDAVDRYRNNQSHKFFGYKTLADTSWKRISLDDDIEAKVSPNEVPKNGAIVERTMCL